MRPLRVGKVASEPAGDGGSQPRRPAAVVEELHLLHRLAADAVARQPDTEAVLAGVRQQASLGVLAPRGGPLARHFAELAETARLVQGDAARGYADVLYRLLSYHAELLRQALELSAAWWTSERLAVERRRLQGLGAPGAKLRELERELREVLDLERELQEERT
jgi:non-ribosomal peptide synthetase component F